MVNGYLITVLIAALATFCAVFAPRRTRLLARTSFWLGVAINELPVYAIVWLLASTVFAGLDGTLRSRDGSIAMVLAVVTIGGLVVVLRRGLVARPALADALGAAGLGAGAQRVLEAGSARRTLASVLAPFAVRQGGVRHLKNISYGRHRRHNLLDIYRSETPQRSAPVFVYFHGGGYFSGRKNKESRLLLYRLARSGWMCVSANYRLRPSAELDEHLADLDAVLAWVREHAADHGADGARVVLAGSSAGAHMASLAALSRSTDVQAVVCLYGYYGYYYGLGPADVPSSSPIDHVHPDAPPFVIVHGDHDTYVPVSGARDFAQRLRDVSRNAVVYAELPGAQHSFDVFGSPRFASTVDAIEASLDELGSSVRPGP